MNQPPIKEKDAEKSDRLLYNLIYGGYALMFIAFMILISSLVVKFTTPFFDALGEIEARKQIEVKEK